MRKIEAALGVKCRLGFGQDEIVGAILTVTLPLKSLTEPNYIPLSEVMDSMERLSRGEIPSKVMVRPSMSS